MQHNLITAFAAVALFLAVGCNKEDDSMATPGQQDQPTSIAKDKGLLQRLVIDRTPPDYNMSIYCIRLEGNCHPVIIIHGATADAYNDLLTAVDNGETATFFSDTVVVNNLFPDLSSEFLEMLQNDEVKLVQETDELNSDLLYFNALDAAFSGNEYNAEDVHFTLRTDASEI